MTSGRPVDRLVDSLASQSDTMPPLQRAVVTYSFFTRFFLHPILFLECVFLSCNHRLIRRVTSLKCLDFVEKEMFSFEKESWCRFLHIVGAATVQWPLMTAMTTT